ncbi:MAG: hypothetical protein ACOX5G_11290 [Kiritimatiellia bacterium]|jgi:hypothetical protein
MSEKHVPSPETGEKPLLSSETEEVTSEQLLEVFTRGNFLKWVLVAIVAHAIFIGIFSVGSIVKRFSPPKPVPAEEEAAEAAPAPAGDAAATTAGTGDSTAAPAAAGDTSEEGLLQERASSPVVQRITETASPEEIPAVPDDLGISFEDTQFR